MEENKDVSKIKVDDTVYNVKDAELRKMLEILLQNAPVKTESKKQDAEQN